jgi:hypothetical protein
VLIQLNQIMRGWSAFFRHSVAKNTMDSLENIVWHRVIRWMPQTAPLELARRPPASHRT